MANALKTNPDDLYNPDSTENYRAQARKRAIQDGDIARGIDEAEKYANDPNNSTSRNGRAADELSSLEDSALDDLSQSSSDADSTRTLSSAEENPNGYYQPGQSTAGRVRSGINKAKQAGGVQGLMNKAKNLKGTVKNWRKWSPTLALVLSLLGFGGVATTIFSPALAITHLKETMAKDLNDQIGPMTARSNLVLRTKIKNHLANGPSICGEKLKVNCRFKKMSPRHIKRLEKNGFTLMCNGSPCGNDSRVRPSAIKHNSTGKSYTNAKEMMKAVKTDVRLASDLRRAYNTKVVSVMDNIGHKALRRLGIGLDNVKAKGKEKSKETKKELTKVAKEGNASSPDKIKVAGGDDKLDDKQKEKAKEINKDIEKDVEAAKKAGTKTASRIGKSVARGVSLIGWADTACSVVRTALAVSQGMKLIGKIQMARYALQFMVVGDKIKAGKATPEDVAPIGDILTSTVTQKKVEMPKQGSDITALGKGGSTEMVDNPQYGKNAFDSTGFKLAGQKGEGNSPKVSDFDKPYSLGNGFSVTAFLGGHTGLIQGFLNTCKVVQNWFVRGAAMVAGIVVGIASFGWSTAAGIALSASAGFALAYFQDQLISILAGNIITEDMSSVDTGNAIFAGTASYFGEAAQNRGLKPLKTKDEIKEQLAFNREINNQHIAIDTYEARSEPFNIYNQYSFAGAFTRKIADITLPAGVSPLTKMAKLAALPVSSLSSIAHAEDDHFDEERFQQCDDIVYNIKQIEADAFCNLRYGLPKEDMNIDPQAVEDYMVRNQFVDPEADDENDKEAKGDFKKFIESCINREEPLGFTDDENEDIWKDGTVCYDPPAELKEKVKNFRLYYIDKYIAKGMDEDPDADESGGSEDNNGGEYGSGEWAPFYAGGTDDTGSTTGGEGEAKYDAIIGDSIAQGAAETGGIAADIKNFRVGASSREVLDKVKSEAGKLNGKSVLLSTGMSNSPDDRASVTEMMKTLKDAGAKVSVIGISKSFPNGDPNAINSFLENESKKNGFTFFGALNDVSGDNVHPNKAEYDRMKRGGGSISIKTPKVGSIASGFEERHFLAGENWHWGLDIPSGTGSAPIHAPTDMEITGITSQWGAVQATPTEGPKFLLSFVHMREIKVNKGDKVKKGDVIGIEGGRNAYGPDFAPHLHFETSKPTNECHDKMIGFYGSPSQTRDQNPCLIDPGPVLEAHGLKYRRQQ